MKSVRQRKARDKRIADYVKAKFEEFWEFTIRHRPGCFAQCCGKPRFKGSTLCVEHVVEHFSEFKEAEE